MEIQKIKKLAGRISPTPMGDYDDTTTYRRLDWVYYGGTSYICKKNNTLGIKPSDPERWQKIIDEIGDMELVFTEIEAEKLENIASGDKLSIILGKIQKWFANLKPVAFSGSYVDLENKPTATDIGALPTRGDGIIGNLDITGGIHVNDISPKESRQQNGTIILHKSIYGGGSAKVEKSSNITPILAESDILSTTEEISANTDSSNVAGALAVKAMMADYNSQINQINSNMAMVSVGNPIYGSADIEHNAYNTLCSFTLPPGTHLIIANVTFVSNDIGIRRIGLSDDGKRFHMNRLAVKNEQAISGNDTVVLLYYVHVSINEDTLYLMAQQNSGNTLSNCTYGIRALLVENAKQYTIPHEFLN